LARGYTAATVDAICGEAGATKGAFYHLFESKRAFAEELLGQVFAPVQAFQGALEEVGVEPLALLERHIDFMASFLPGDGRLMGILSQELGQRDPAFRDELRGYFREWTGTLERMVALVKARYAPDVELSTHEVMTFIVLAVEGAPVVARQFGDEALERALSELKGALRRRFGIDG
jgi:AcrR family transcriptional regulator